MKRSLTRAALRPNRLRLAGAIQVITCVMGVNAVSALGQHFNQIAADAIADCIGGQILQSMPLFASMSSGGLDPSSIATQIAMAFIGSTLLTIFPSLLSKLRARPHSRFLCLALPLSKSGVRDAAEQIIRKLSGVVGVTNRINATSTRFRRLYVTSA